MKFGKASIFYSIGISLLSIAQLLLIYDLLVSNHAINIPTDLYVDGADFSPFLSLAEAGANSIVYLVSIIVDVVIGTLISLIVMRVLRYFALPFFTEKTTKLGIIITLICGIVFFFIGCIFVKFNPILDLFILYIPIPLVSFLSYHLGKNPQNK